MSSKQLRRHFRKPIGQSVLVVAKPILSHCEKHVQGTAKVKLLSIFRFKQVKLQVESFRDYIYNQVNSCYST